MLTCDLPWLPRGQPAWLCGFVWLASRTWAGRSPNPISRRASHQCRHEHAVDRGLWQRLQRWRPSLFFPTGGGFGRNRPAKIPRSGGRLFPVISHPGGLPQFLGTHRATCCRRQFPIRAKATSADQILITQFGNLPGLAASQLLEACRELALGCFVHVPCPSSGDFLPGLAVSKRHRTPRGREALRATSP